MGVEPPLDASSLFLIKGSSAGIKEHRDRQCRPARAGLGNCPGDPAYCWEAAAGFPPEVAEALQRTDEAALADLTPVLATPEFKVPLPGGVRPSQNDLFVLARGAKGPVSSWWRARSASPLAPRSANGVATLHTGRSRVSGFCSARSA